MLAIKYTQMTGVNISASFFLFDVYMYVYGVAKTNFDGVMHFLRCIQMNYDRSFTGKDSNGFSPHNRY